MLSYIVRRLCLAVVVIFLITISIFLMMRLLPGDPLYFFLGMDDVDVSTLTPDEIQGYRHEFGLDKSLPEQYITWINGVLHGDFGDSLQLKRPINEVMAETYPVTIYLGLQAFILSSILGIVCGLLAGLFRGKWIDQVLTTFVYIGVATPQFWLGIVLLFIFSLTFQVLPMAGFSMPTEDFGMSIKQSIMPIICLSVLGISSTMRQMRTSIIDVIRKDYIRTARSKGLKQSIILKRHALKNSLIPVITIIGLNVRNIFGGSVLVEMVFSIPGIGHLAVTSVNAHDFQMVQSITLITAVVVVLTNLIVDLLYGFLDPRIRYN